MDGTQAISSGTAYPQYTTETKPSQEAEEARKNEATALRDQVEISKEGRMQADALKEREVEEKENFKGFSVPKQQSIFDVNENEERVDRVSENHWLD
jgi:hypothetical protein